MDANKPAGTVRERLLQAADELFYREGIHTVGIDRILEHAGVAKASLYGTFGSKDELVRAYLAGRAARLEERIEARVAAATHPRDRVLAVFDGFGARVAEGSYYGCPFARACAELPLEPTVAREVTAAHRAWRQALFRRLLAEAGVRDVAETSRQLAIIYDGAAACAGLDGDPGVALAARRAVEALLHDQASTPRTQRGAHRASARKARAR